jgi:hypothetical protein
MKRKIITLFLILPISLLTLNSFSQCVPATPEQCPDPENNGQVCPDSLVMAHVGQFYSQVATIKPPASYMMADSTEIPLHHAQLIEVGNMPAGITWQTNAENNNFLAGQYYCVLLEGTPELEGNYNLRIVVDIYVLILGTPVKIAQVTDSTSLTLVVADDAGIQGDENASLFVHQNIPNPFQCNTRIDFHSKIAGTIDFEVYSILGKKVWAKQISASKGENSLIFSGQMLPEGPYYFIFRSAGIKTTGIMIRKD